MFIINIIKSIGAKFIKKLIIVLGIFIFIIIVIVVFFGGGAVSEEESSCSNDATDASVSSSGSMGAWTQKGTKAYNVAKSLFDFFVKKEGFSGAGAAGAVANASRESSFNPKAYNPAGQVAGIFQWSLDGSVNGGTGGKGRISSGGYISGDGKRGLNLKNQLKLTHYELHHGYSAVRPLVGKATDPYQAAKDWSVRYEGVALSDEQTKLSKLKTDSQKAYRMFGGSKYKAKNSLLGSAAKSADSSSSDQSGDDECDDGSDIGNGGPLLDEAKKLLGYFTYGGHGPASYGGWKHPNKNGQTDCSGFVWLAMKRAGYPVGNDAFSTPTMEADARGPHKYLKQISAKNAKPGDVIIMNVGGGSGQNGHTAIIAGKYKGYQTKIIEMGGTNNGHIHTSNIHDSFLSLIPNARITWARPVGKK